MNDSDDGVVALLTHLLGIPENTTDVPIESSCFDANVKHAYYYLFQKQGISRTRTSYSIARTSRTSPRAIKDTLPILLGVFGKDKFTPESQLRYAQRELRLNAKLLQQAGAGIDNSEERAIGLLSEARAVEISLGWQRRAANRSSSSGAGLETNICAGRQWIAGIEYQNE